ncbi:unnamed protein product [Closterium sp. Naga37s-1]|nr:unnamed protein product [Closterium sp. Naga37s-1]
MTSSPSSRSQPPASLVPFCALLLLATLLSPFCVAAAAPEAARGAARGGSARRVLQEPPASDEIISAESSALLALKQALGDHPAFSLAGRWSDGPSPNRQGQLSQPCADTWQFVTCDSTGRVVAIDLANPFLASLNASWARGATPAAVAQQLTARGASQQAVAAAVAAGVVGPLRGEIPWGRLTALQRLEQVDLSGNEVSGAAVSAATALLPNLKHLNLTFNRIDSLPAAVTAMTALKTLYHSHDCARDAASVFGLFALPMAARSPQASLPSLLSPLPSPPPATLYVTPPSPFPPCSHLDMNRITGSLPAGLSALSRLSALVLGQNQIVGQLPEELGALTDLVTLDLGDNHFQGQPPDSWSKLTNLQVLSLYRLPITAAFPPSWAALASLSFFSFSSAAASGPFPAFLTQLPNIQHIYLHSNRLSGPLPADLWRPSLLTDVDISNNFFNGSVPLPPPERQADFRYFFNCFSSATSPSDMPAAADGQLDAATCAQFYSPPPEIAAAAGGTQQQPSPSDSTWGSSFFTVCLLIALTILLVAISLTCCRLVQQRRQQQRDMQQQQQQQQEQMRVDVDSDAAVSAHGANTAILSPSKDSNQPFLAGVALSSF